MKKPRKQVDLYPDVAEHFQKKAVKNFRTLPKEVNITLREQMKREEKK